MLWEYFEHPNYYVNSLYIIVIINYFSVGRWWKILVWHVEDTLLNMNRRVKIGLIILILPMLAVCLMRKYLSCVQLFYVATFVTHSWPTSNRGQYCLCIANSWVFNSSMPIINEKHLPQRAQQSINMGVACSGVCLYIRFEPNSSRWIPFLRYWFRR